MKKLKGGVVAVILICSLLAVINPVSSATTLSLTKGSWNDPVDGEIIGLDSNKPATEGPNQYLIQIHVTNTGGEAATNVSATLTWDTANTYVNLATNEVFTKDLGDIAVGATVDLFYLIEIARDTNAYFTSRDYTITVSGDNTGAPNTISGQLYVEKLVSQNRNNVTSMVASTTTPSVGDTFTITVVSETGAKNYKWVNLPISEYNSSVIEPVSVTCTYDSTTSNDVALQLPGSDYFTSVWTFRAVAPGTSNATSFITDKSGSSFHYNKDYPDTITITVRGSADLRLEKTVSNPTPSPGDTVTFTITVYNDGPDTATNIDVEDVIPNGYTYVAASIAGGDSRDDTGLPTLTWTINSLASGNNTALTFQAVVQASGDYKNVAQVTASDQYDPDSTPNNDDGDQSEDDEAFVIAGQPVTVPKVPLNPPYQPQESLQPLAYHLRINCYDEFRDLIERIRQANPDIEWKREVPCCEALEDLVNQLIGMVLEKGLNKEYPEEWARVQELLPYVGQCCRNLEQYYNAGNYVASIHWSRQRNQAYRELIEILLEILGF